MEEYMQFLVSIPEMVRLIEIPVTIPVNGVYRFNSRDGAIDSKFKFKVFVFLT